MMLVVMLVLCGCLFTALRKYLLEIYAEGLRNVSTGS